MKTLSDFILAFALSSSSCPIVSIDSLENSFKTCDINSSVVVFPLGVPPIIMRLSCWLYVSLDINVSNLNEGIYILEIVSDKEVDKVKIVIER